MSIPATQPPTQRELADRLNLSQQAVSYALRGKPGVSDAVRERVLQAARGAGYRPSSAARSMRSGRTRHVGIVIHSLGLGAGGGHAYDTISGISKVLEPAGYATSLVRMIDVESSDDGLSRVFREQTLDGMIVHAAVYRRIRERLDGLSGRIVWCDAGVQEAENCLWRDEAQAGRLVARAVVEAGYERAVFVCDDEADDPHPYLHREGREAGLREVFAAAGVELTLRHFVKQQDRDDATFGRVIEQLDGRTALIACDYKHATYLLGLASALGRCVGADVPLVCCDDRDVWDRDWPNCSRARFNRFGLGLRAGRMLLDLLEHDRQTSSHIDAPTFESGHGMEPRRPTLTVA